MKILETKRLILRTWRDSDLDPMLVINQDKRVMEFFPKTYDLEETKSLISKINKHQQKYGYSLYATEVKNTSEFIGFIGLIHANFKAHFTPAIEVGWRLSYNSWGNGYATEAAKAVLDYAFSNLGLKEIVSFTAANNKRSIRVMEKIGLKHDKKDDFYHPLIDDNSELRRHVLYKISLA